MHQSLLIGDTGGHVVGRTLVTLRLFPIVIGLHLHHERAPAVLVSRRGFAVLHRHLQASVTHEEEAGGGERYVKSYKTRNASGLRLLRED